MKTTVAPFEARQVICGFVLLIALLNVTIVSGAQESAVASVVDFSTRFRITPNVTYHESGSWEGKLDLYIPSAADGPKPVLIWYFGGGWVISSKEADGNFVLPYIEMGFAVANVGYRLAGTSPAPAAAEDAICALRWVSRNAETYNLDPERIVLAGRSSGGHLALYAGLSPHDHELVKRCATRSEFLANDLKPARAAAVVNWYGITDVVDLVQGDNALIWAQRWVEDELGLAKYLSPLAMSSPGDPPVITVHGDADPLVPHDHAIRLHEALDRAGVANELVTIEGGGHSGFTVEEYQRSYQAIEAFLRTHVLSQR